MMGYLLPNELGINRLDRFERVHLVGFIKLSALAEGRQITFEDAEAMLMSGESKLLLQRRYTDGSVRIFDIGPEGRLTLHQTGL